MHVGVCHRLTRISYIQNFMLQFKYEKSKKTTLLVASEVARACAKSYALFIDDQRFLDRSKHTYARARALTRFEDKTAKRDGFFKKDHAIQKCVSSLEPIWARRNRKLARTRAFCLCACARENRQGRPMMQASERVRVRFCLLRVTATCRRTRANSSFSCAANDRFFALPFARARPFYLLYKAILIVELAMWAKYVYSLFFGELLCARHFSLACAFFMVEAKIV